MISARVTIKEIPNRRQEWAIVTAARLYEKWKTERAGQVDFNDDLNYYLAHGFVISRPTCFCMCIVVEGENGEPCWFVRMAAGDLAELITALPGYLPRISFCRHKDPRVREYSLDRLAKRVLKTGGSLTWEKEVAA